MVKKYILWAILGLIILALYGGFFAFLTLVMGLTISQAVLVTILALLLSWYTSSREKEAEPLVMNESVWLDVDSDKE